MSEQPKKKMGRPCKLTPEVQALVCASVRAGSFAWIAAASAGITQSTYFRWMDLGKTQWAAYEIEVDKWLELEPQGEDEAAKAQWESLMPTPTNFAEFWHEVETARGQARLAAETAVKKDNPLAWLRYGPGRDRPGQPGWTETVKQEITGKDGAPIGSLPVHDLSKLTDEELDEFERLNSKCTLLPESGGSESGEGAP